MGVITALGGGGGKAPPRLQLLATINERMMSPSSAASAHLNFDPRSLFQRVWIITHGQQGQRSALCW